MTASRTRVAKPSAPKAVSVEVIVPESVEVATESVEVAENVNTETALEVSARVVTTFALRVQGSRDTLKPLIEEKDRNRLEVARLAEVAKKKKAAVTVLSDEMKLERLALRGSASSIRDARSALKGIDAVAASAGRADVADSVVTLAKARVLLAKAQSKKRSAEVVWDDARVDVASARVDVATVAATIAHTRADVSATLAMLAGAKRALITAKAAEKESAKAATA